MLVREGVGGRGGERHRGQGGGRGGHWGGGGEGERVPGVGRGGGGGGVVGGVASWEDGEGAPEM